MVEGNAVSAADHHATEARRWADAADREEVNADRDPAGAATARGRANHYAAISTAHAGAAIATVLASGCVITQDGGRV